MLTNDHILTTINRIIYDSPLDADLQSTDVALLNSFPINEVIAILLDMFYREKDVIVKSKIYNAILSIKSFDTVRLLLDIFEQSSIDWRTVYCRSLSKFRDSRAIDKLCSVLFEGTDSNMRYVAAESLAEIGDSTAISALEYAQNNDIGEDFEGFPVAEMARDSLIKIINRIG